MRYITVCLTFILLLTLLSACGRNRNVSSNGEQDVQQGSAGSALVQEQRKRQIAAHSAIESQKQ